MSGSYTGIFAELKVKLGFGDAGFVVLLSLPGLRLIWEFGVSELHWRVAG